MSTIDIAAIERLLAAAVAYRKSKSSGDNWRINDMARAVLNRAADVASPARLSKREAAIIAAANAYREVEASWMQYEAGSSDKHAAIEALRHAASQPEEAADDVSA